MSLPSANNVDTPAVDKLRRAHALLDEAAQEALQRNGRIRSISVKIRIHPGGKLGAPVKVIEEE